MSDALATYGSALLVLALSAGIGAGVQAACGARRYSPLSVAVGFAATLIVAWWAVRLPSGGTSALIVLGVLAVAGAVFASRRLAAPSRLRTPIGLTVVGGLLLGSVPFAVEGHFGILGTGFNVDMSQHLFAASWIADARLDQSALYEQGYPLGPHSVAVVAEAVNGDLALAFTGFTVAIPVVAALAVLGCFPSRGRGAVALALLTAFAYLTASWYAQGAFKELIESTLLIAFVAWLRATTRSSEAWPGGGAALAVPAAVLVAGSLYAYSGPGLVWLTGALLVWVALEFLLDRRRVVATGRRALMPGLVAVLALVVLAAPELSRIADFGANVGTVTERSSAALPALASEARADADEQAPAGPTADSEPAFNDDLGNLFGQINPLTAFGVWPSGDFRVLPGDGAVPAIVFWLGAALGIAAFVLGLRRLGRKGETAILAALFVAGAIWLAARIGSTPYTTAKALQILSVPIMLTSLLGAQAALRGVRELAARGQGLTASAAAPGLIAAAFVTAAALSSGLALAKAPVGPSDYVEGVRILAPRFAGVPTQLLVSPGELADRHGRDFYGWELRGARRTCVDAIPANGGGDPPPGIRLVLVIGDGRPPYSGLVRIGSRGEVVVWQVKEPDGLDRLVVDPENPTICTTNG